MNGEWPVLAIDGPSGSGKGTVAGLLAKRLGWNLLDSGALYRLLAFAAGNHGIDLTNEEALKVLAAHLDVQFPMPRADRVSTSSSKAKMSPIPSVRSRSAPAPRKSPRCRRCAMRCCNASAPSSKPPALSPTAATWAPWSSPARR